MPKEVTLKKVLSSRQLKKFFRMKEPVHKSDLIQKFRTKKYIKNKIRAFIQTNGFAEFETVKKQHWLTKKDYDFERVKSSLEVEYELLPVDEKGVQYLVLRLCKTGGDEFHKKLYAHANVLEDYFSKEIKNKIVRDAHIEIMLLFKTPDNNVIDLSHLGADTYE